MMYEGNLKEGYKNPFDPWAKKELEAKRALSKKCFSALL
jgi:hypothetical protein